ncbi:MAG: LVIVD repeat-containing protein [Pyrinomonadaceae bacterium]
MNSFRNITLLFVVCAAIFAVVHVTPAQNLEPAPELPAGMKGADTNDPRAKLKPGLYDAGEVAFGMKHLQLLKKPAAFQLGTDDAKDPRVQKTLALLGVPEGTPMPDAMKLVFAQLAFSNSDLAFQGKYLFQGNFYGVNIFDISKPEQTKLLTTMVCPGGQGDVSIFGNLMFMSVEMPNGRLDCGAQGFPVAANEPSENREPIPNANAERFRGVRIFDVSDIRNPKQVGAVQTCRGSHTHTVVTDPKDKKNIYVYVSGTSFVRQNEELAGCSDGNPKENPETSLFRIDVIKVPLDAPQDAKIVSSPRVFMDSRTGVINSLNDGGSHSAKGRVTDTDQCHDITVYSEIGLAAGACSGNGILLDIRDPANPKRVDAVNDKNYAYWHSATFSNDGKKVVFTDEWGGGMGARCRANDPNVWGANAIFNIKNDKLEFDSYYKMPAAQGDSENCVAHNGSLVPVPGRDIEVQSWYQGGISVMDFTDAKNPKEIAYFDRGPIDPNILILGGNWSTYWYNGHIYSSEIARGLDVFDLVPSEYLTQAEIDAAKSVQVAEFNPQDQKRVVYPKTLKVAKAYLAQLERNKSLSEMDIAQVRDAIDKATNSGSAQKAKKLLKASVKRLAKQINVDSERMTKLVEILKNPQV